MQKRSKPVISFGECYKACQCKEKKKEQLRDFMEVIKHSHDRYEDLANKGILHLYQPININKSARATLLNLYTYNLLRKELGRAIYDKLILSSRICPYCNYGVSYTLDHYLAKSKYPEFSIYPSNLVPSCRDCNTEKKDKSSVQEEEQYIHPYFDTIDFPWLTAKVLFNKNKPIIEFSVKEDVVKTMLGKRVSYHFYSLKINKTYEVAANQELVAMESIFKSFKNGEEPRGNFKAYLRSFKELPINTWKKAFYECLANSEKFCALTWEL